MAPLPLLLALLSAGAGATPIPADAVAKAKAMRQCLKVNPFPAAEARATQWNNACIDQRDACALLGSDAERERVAGGYCLVCSDRPASGCGVDRSCEPERVCKAPPAGAAVRLGPPPEGEGETRAAADRPAPARPRTRACSATPGCIARYVRAAHAEGKPLKDQMKEAWSASRYARDQKDFSQCDAIPLRDAEHYLYHYWSRLDSQVYNQFPLTFCGISYGYSFAKWSGIKKLIIDDDNANDSPPSMEEAYWGCRGLWDAYDQNVAFGSCD